VSSKKNNKINYIEVSLATLPPGPFMPLASTCKHVTPFFHGSPSVVHLLFLSDPYWFPCRFVSDPFDVVFEISYCCSIVVKYGLYFPFVSIPCHSCSGGGGGITLDRSAIYGLNQSTFKTLCKHQ
jgi:hypothetical protein